VHCKAKPARVKDLDAAVWRDVCKLLREPQRIETEYKRRLDNPEDRSPTSQSLESRINQVKRGIARLIDAYRDGLLDKSEFEPQIRTSKERLTRLETEQKEMSEQESRRAELRLVIGQLTDFTQRMSQGLEEADWCTRREIIRALVKQIEVNDEQIRIVYRVNTVPFVKAPNGGFAQDCPRGRSSYLDRFWMVSQSEQYGPLTVPVFARATLGPSRRLRSQPLRRLFTPHLGAKRATARFCPAHALQLSLGLWLIDHFHPVFRHVRFIVASFH
jgi:hypothetical protein